MDKRVGFIGLGQMGAPMTRRLIEAGYEVWGYDIHPPAAETLAQAGGRAAASIGQVAENAETILLSLPDSTAVESVVEGEGGLLHTAPTGRLVIDMSTSYPPSTRRLGKILEEKEINFLDAPVSGGVRGAVAGTLTVMVGGEENLFEKSEPILRVFGPNVHYVGGLGTGHILKALNNFLSASHLLATSEAMIVATRLGLDPDRTIEILNQSTGRSNTSEVKFPKYILPRTFDAGFPLRLLLKDVSITTRLAKEENIPMHSANLLEQMLAFAAAQGGGDWDHTALIRMLEEWTDEIVRGKDAKD
jgi:3-hydroxyisobutyrate dehydrogenase-like beta-hydroxyacid dehydrogenase